MDWVVGVWTTNLIDYVSYGSSPIHDEQLKENEEQLTDAAVEGGLELMVLARCFLVSLFLCMRSASNFLTAFLQIALQEDLSCASCSILCGSAARALYTYKSKNLLFSLNPWWQATLMWHIAIDDPVAWCISLSVTRLRCAKWLNGSRSCSVLRLLETKVVLDGKRWMNGVGDSNCPLTIKHTCF